MSTKYYKLTQKKLKAIKNVNKKISEIDKKFNSVAENDEFKEKKLEKLTA